MKTERTLNPEDEKKLMLVLETRFKSNPRREQTLQWEDILQKLKTQPQKLWSLSEMEKTGGEPQVLTQDPESGAFLFYDTSAESPLRRSLCYDQKALDSRKENKPAGAALDLAEEMGIELLDEGQYRTLQSFGVFDSKTSSWLKTPENIRQLGGAIFGDFRYGQVFIYHNGASSYYAARGFRGLLRV